MKKRKKKKRNSGVVLLSIAVALFVSVNGTLAWLVAQTDPVINTFTYGDINLILDETQTDEKGNPVDESGNLIPDGGTPVRAPEGNQYDMLPGEKYLKDPAVTVKPGNEACWLFVKLTETGGYTDAAGTVYTFDDYLSYDIAAGWTQLTDATGNTVDGVYYRYVEKDAAGTYDVLKDNKIKVRDEVTKAMLNGLDDNGQDKTSDKYPSLAIIGYAIQYSGFEAGDLNDDAKVGAAAGTAWTAIQEQTKSND